MENPDSSQSQAKDKKIGGAHPARLNGTCTVPLVSAEFVMGMDGEVKNGVSSSLTLARERRGGSSTPLDQATVVVASA